MYMIAGLGNTGREYQNTRHNIGFDVIVRIADAYHIEMSDKKHKAISGRGVIDGTKVILVKPQTYMNLSGESIRQIADYYDVDTKEELIVIHDDISLDVGQIRIRTKGSAGGHNGLKNIILNLGHDRFSRIKVGVGEKPKGYDLADYVLGHFTTEERKVLETSGEHAVEAVRMVLAGDPEGAMNRFNTKVSGR